MEFLGRVYTLHFILRIFLLRLWHLKSKKTEVIFFLSRLFQTVTPQTSQKSPLISLNPNPLLTMPLLQCLSFYASPPMPLLLLQSSPSTQSSTQENLTSAKNFVYPVSDTGAWVHAAFSHPEDWLNQDMRIATEWLSSRDFADIASKVTGKKVRPMELTEDQFSQTRNAGWIPCSLLFVPGYLSLIRVVPYFCCSLFLLFPIFVVPYFCCSLFLLFKGHLFVPEFLHCCPYYLRFI